MCGKVFTVLKIGHFFCPFFKTLDILCLKNLISQHKVFLACDHQKNNFHFVTIKILLFQKKSI